MAESKVRTAVAALEERLQDLGAAGSAPATPSLQGVDLHPAVRAVAGELFRDGHFANAVENACKALNDLQRITSGV